MGQTAAFLLQSLFGGCHHHQPVDRATPWAVVRRLHSLSACPYVSGGHVFFFKVTTLFMTRSAFWAVLRLSVARGWIGSAMLHPSGSASSLQVTAEIQVHNRPHFWKKSHFFGLSFMPHSRCRLSTCLTFWMCWLKLGLKTNTSSNDSMRSTFGMIWRASTKLWFMVAGYKLHTGKKKKITVLSLQSWHQICIPSPLI